MQLILPRSLPNQPGWSTGPLIAQGAHAACAILALTSQHPLTREYLSPEGLRGGMHKVVLQWPGKEKKKKKQSSAAEGEGVGVGQEEEEGLEELSRRLSAARVEWEKRQQERTVSRDQDEEEAEEEFPVHTMWVEQPDNIPTCIAIAPNRKPPVSEERISCDRMTMVLIPERRDSSTLFSFTRTGTEEDLEQVCPLPGLGKELMLCSHLAS
jgi:hypothetical protein